VGVVTSAAPFLERVAVLRQSEATRRAVRAMRIEVTGRRCRKAQRRGVHALPVVLGGVDDQGERGSLDRS